MHSLAIPVEALLELTLALLLSGTEIGSSIRAIVDCVWGVTQSVHSSESCCKADFVI